MSLNIYIYIFIFITGCCIGSFLNVVILRAFSGESIIFPPSKCPKCNNKLKWYHNIPILSYLFLKGKCAFCNKPISIQYPIVELLTGCIFTVTFIKYNTDISKLLFCWYFMSIFIVLSVCDLKEKVIFDIHTFYLVAGGLLFNLFNVGNLYTGMKLINLGFINFDISNSFLASLGGIIIGILAFELVARTGYLLAGTRAFGEGDTYIVAGLGAIFGWINLFQLIVCAFIIQLIVSLPLFLIKLIKRKEFKTLGSMVTFIFFVILTMLSMNYTLLYIISLLGLIISGSITCERILSGIKQQIPKSESKSDTVTLIEQNNELDSLTYLPFGPALVLSAIYLYFKLI